MRYIRFSLLAALTLAALALVACDGGEPTPGTPTGAASDSPTPTSTAPATVTATPDITPTPTEAVSLPETLLETLREDLVEALTVGVNPVEGPDVLETVGVEEVTSPDDCLPGLSKPADCPPAEMLPGYRVTLRRTDFGVDYIYYTDGKERHSRPWQLPLPPPTPVASDTLPPPLLELLREHLAERLSIHPESIEVALVEEAVWDGCFGVPSGDDDTAGPCGPFGFMLGYEVTLVAMGQEYRYHAMREEPFQFRGPVDGQ